MKIAFVVKYFPTISETFIVNQINGLIDLGLNVHLYAYNKVDAAIIHDSLKKHNLLYKVQYFIKPPESRIKRLQLFLNWTVQHFLSIKWSTFFRCLNIFKYGKDAYTLKLFFEAQWFLIPYDFELIHAHFGMNGNRIAYLKACGIIPKEVKLINTFHGYDLEPDKLDVYKKTYENLFKEAHAFTVNTSYLENILLQVNIFEKPCYILPVGLDTNYFERQNAKEDYKYFELVFCGKLIPLKGPDLAIKMVLALHNAGYTQVRLHIIGNGTMREQLEKQVEDCHLKDRVFFYGALSQEAIIKHFEKADVFILPGRYDPDTGRAETQGLVIQEAQAMELPVIVSDVGGMKYGLLPTKSGFVIREGNIKEFVVAIEKLILNPKLKFKMGEVGRRFVKNEYDIKVLTNKLLEIYNKVL